MNPKCSDCRFFHQPEKGLEQAQCRRHAAIRDTEVTRPIDLWPLVSGDGWCGEYKDR